MANRLSNMEITEISLVDEPANDDARVVIVKSKGGEAQPASPARIAGALFAAIQELSPQIVEKAVADGFSADPQAAASAAALIQEFVMDLEAVTKALEEAEAKLDVLEKRATAAEAATKENETIIKAKDARIAELEGAANPDAAEEELMKSLPESIRKRLEEADAKTKAAEAEVQKAKDEAERTEAIAKAKALKVADPEKVADLMLRVAKGKTTPEDAALIEGVLKSAAEVDAKSPLFKAMGTSDATEAEPEAVLKRKADEILKAAEGKMTFAQAYDRALAENPEVYAEYIAKRRA